MKQKANGGLTLPSSFLQVIIADDYSDPFDAKNDLKSKAGKGESAGYMEPYEAQRIMTGKQKLRMGRSAQQGGEQEGRPQPSSAGEGLCFQGAGWKAAPCGIFTPVLPVRVLPTSSGRTWQGHCRFRHQDTKHSEPRQGQRIQWGEKGVTFYQEFLTEET